MTDSPYLRLIQKTGVFNKGLRVLFKTMSVGKLHIVLIMF